MRGNIGICGENRNCILGILLCDNDIEFKFEAEAICDSHAGAFCAGILIMYFSCFAILCDKPDDATLMLNSKFLN